MKLTKNGYRISKNGNPIKSTEKNAVIKAEEGAPVIKENGTYYFFNRKQGNEYIYLP